MDIISNMYYYSTRYLIIHFSYLLSYYIWYSVGLGNFHFFENDFDNLVNYMKTKEKETIILNLKTIILSF